METVDRPSPASVPRRMSPAAVLVMISKNIRSLGWILLITFTPALVRGFDPESMDRLLYLLAVAAGLFGYVIVSAIVRYMCCTYWVEDGKLMFRHGVFSRKTDVIPLDSIHSLRTRRGIVYRMLEMRGIVFDTLASKYDEVELILDEPAWAGLIGAIGTEERREQTHDRTLPPPISNVICIPNLNIIRGALCQNHLKGLAVLWVTVGTVINEIMGDEELGRRAFDSAVNYAESVTVSFQGVLLTAAVLYLVMMVLWTARTLLVYANMEIRVEGDTLTVECGLLSRNSARLSRDKVCALQVKQNYLERQLNTATIRLLQAANVGDKEGRLGKLGVTLYGSDMAPFFISWWLGSDAGAMNSDEITQARSGRGLFFRVFGQGLLYAAIAAVALWYLEAPAYLYGVAPLIALFFGAGGILSMRHSSITLYDPYVRVNVGAFALRRTYLRYTALQELRLRRTPLTPRTRRVSLTLTTAGPTLTVRSLFLPHAAPVYDRLLAQPLL